MILAGLGLRKVLVAGLVSALSSGLGGLGPALLLLPGVSGSVASSARSGCRPGRTRPPGVCGELRIWHTKGLPLRASSIQHVLLISWQFLTWLLLLALASLF